MTKFITAILMFTLFSSNIFAYNPTTNDYKKLNIINNKIDSICEKSEKNCKNIKNKIDKISYKFKKKEKLYFLLTQISKHIGEKLEKNNEISIENLLSLDTYKKEKKNEKIKESKIIVIKVSDGDTIHFKKNGKDYVTRLIGIDSPENTTTRYGYTEKLGNEAKIYLNNLILNKEIQIEYDSTQARTDKYGRHLVYIFYKGENINKKMIEQGLAKEYTYNKPYKYQKEFLKAQENAKKLKKGIWSLKKEEVKKVINQIQNHNIAPSGNCNIKGNINSKGVKIYHYPGCKSYKRTKITTNKGERYFCSEEEARKAGWRVAGNCN